MVQHSRRWVETSDVIPMFPTFVWQVRIEAGLRDALRETILAAIAEMRMPLPPLAPGQGWQSGQALHRREDFRELVACVNGGVATILRFLRIGDERCEITGCWATVLAPGAAHKLHSHLTTTSAVSTMFAPARAPTASTFTTLDGRPV